MGDEYIKIESLLFPGTNPDLKKVEEYINKTFKEEYIVRESQDIIRIGSKFSSEYCGSLYTKKLRGALLKAKANAVQALPDLIVSAKNKRWNENKAEKHIRNASKGWFRYDVKFSIPVYDNFGKQIHENIYSATLVARINDEGIFLYDMINIKKEASKPFES